MLTLTLPEAGGGVVISASAFANASAKRCLNSCGTEGRGTSGQVVFVPPYPFDPHPELSCLRLRGIAGVALYRRAVTKCYRQLRNVGGITGRTRVTVYPSHFSSRPTREDGVVLSFAPSLGAGVRVGRERASRPRARALRPRVRVAPRAGDFPKPDLDVPSNANYQEAKALSARIAANASGVRKPQRVVVVGGGLAGLSCAKYLADASHHQVLERARFYDKVSAWQDADAAG